MHTQSVKLPRGQSLIKMDESVDGHTIAMTKVSSSLHAIYWVSPNGSVEDPIYAGERSRAEGLFEARLLGSC
ncbi:hypothetical protein [Sphingomonas sp. HMP6]|uniref:hypothetical protein n=1 Tax=Sphingomonas sp. HMP6 TaxID=1517551 RepID=UPI001596CD8E|nr:hypothetical protein [Sphingomonas sp. HMP6]BCA57695.1 hypothetical protein HMP06_0464 [Sphingomonas sp. HMP6]